MNKIRIVADSTCDLSKDLLERYQIAILPLYIVMGEQSFLDGEQITPEQIYEWADENRTTPKTAAVSYEKAEEILAPFMDAGEDIIFFGISEKMSTTCNVIRLLGEDRNYSRLFVIDSMNLSTGIGLQVLRAAIMAEESKSAEEIVDVIEKSREKVRASFVVDTLTYLARGGRCSSATALLANTLKLRPEIVVRDGAMSVSKKFRGGMQGALLKYAKEMEQDLLQAETACVFITHSGCTSEIVDSVREYLQGLHHFKQIYETRAGGVISSHCGPGTLGILFYSGV